MQQKKIKFGLPGDIVSPQEIQRETNQKISTIIKKLDQMVLDGTVKKCLLPRCQYCGSYQMDAYIMDEIIPETIHCVFCNKKIDKIQNVSKIVYKIL